MDASMDGVGLSWEQLLIAGVAFTVLIVVLFAAFRGAARNRRARREDAAGPDRQEASAMREPSLAAATPAPVARAEPSARAEPIGPRAEPSGPRAEPSGPRAEPSGPRAEPSLVAPSAPLERAKPEIVPFPPQEPEPKPSSPAFLTSRDAEPARKPEIVRPGPGPAPDSQFAPDKPGVDTLGADRAQADNAQAVKALKGLVDELRQENTLLVRRLEETERTLHDMQTEMQAKFASLERAARENAPAAAVSAKEPGAIRPPPPPPPPPPSPARPASNDDDLERARRAIALLSRKDDEDA